MKLRPSQRFMNWYQGNDDIERIPPKSGLKRAGYLIRNYAGCLIISNLIFIVSCLPVFTIPAAITAQNVYLGLMFRDGYGFSWDDYRKEFKADLFKMLPVGIFGLILLLYAYYLLSLAGNFGADGAALTGFGIGAAVFGFLLSAYSFVLASMVELPVRHILKNAVILMVVEWKASLAALAAAAVYWWLFFITMPYSLPVLLLFGFSVFQLIIYAIIEKTVKRRVTEPYEKSKTGY